MAMACFRLLAFGCRPFPAFKVPRFARDTALRTLRPAAAPYLRFEPDFVRDLVEVLLVGMK